MNDTLATPPGPAAPWTERLRWYVSVARHAPSKYNAQPWRFADAGPGRAELYADATRALHASDPDDRELTIGCGAALRVFALAVRGLGYRVAVESLPDGPDGPLARVTEGTHLAPTPDELLLLAAVPARHTNRGVLDAALMNAATPFLLQRAAEDEGAVLQLVTAPGARAAFETLVVRAEHVVSGDEAYGVEAREWLRRNGSAVPPVRQLAFADPALPAVLWTAGDGQRDWLRAGAALQSVLLRATAEGVAASFLNRPLERPHTRLAVRREIGFAGYPQVALRLGVATAEVPATPRRPVDELVVR